MQVIADLDRLPGVPTQAVIINCGTKWVTSLALLSALRNTDCPVVVVDCESNDGSRAHFEALSSRHALSFHWLEWPLRPHPVALDRLFATIPSDSVLLIDSDAEIRTRSVVDGMRSALATDPDAYGAGFLQGPEWLGAAHGLPPFTGYYEERMWVPLVLLRTPVVRGLLNDGHSFMNRRPFVTFPQWPRLSRLLGYRYRLRGYGPLREPPAACGRPVYDGRRPQFVEYDTGAELHAELKRRGHSFAALSPALWGDVRHYHGVTRAREAGILHRVASALRLASRNAAAEPQEVMASVRERLEAAYGVRDL